MEEQYEKVINIFLKYYNDTNGTNHNLFQGIDDMEGTNKIMDDFRDYLFEYNECSEDERQLYMPHEVDLDDFDEVFGLFINNELICISVIIFPMLLHLAKTVELDDNTWRIKKKKRDP